MSQLQVPTENQEISRIQHNLQKYDKFEFSGQKYQAVNISSLKKDIINERIKNGHYADCNFDCNFISSGLSGTYFEHCRFIDSHIKNSNLQFCNFYRDTQLYGEKQELLIENSNLSQSMFEHSLLKNITVSNSTISQAHFLFTTLQNIKFCSSTLQDNLYQNVIMDHVSLIGCNCEYSDFSNVTFKDTALPFHQVPFAFGLLEHLNDPGITVGSVSTETPDISGAAYLELLPSILAYYIHMEDFFPVVNIALFQKDFPLAEDNIYRGIERYVKTNDFRKIKAICKLVADCGQFDKHFMAQLYFKLIEYYNLVTINEAGRYQYSLHINDIKNILTGTERNIPSAQLVIKTNLEASDTNGVGDLHYIIEQCLTAGNISTDDYTIEIRHNSLPLSIWLMINSNEVSNILHSVGLIYSVIYNDPSYLYTVFNILVGAATLGDFYLHIKKHQAPAYIPQEGYKPSQAEQKFISDKNKKISNAHIKLQISTTHFNFLYEHQNNIGD